MDRQQIKTNCDFVENQKLVEEMKEFSSYMFKKMGYICEQCAKDISSNPEILWIESGNSEGLVEERPAYFCSEDCIVAWWNDPPENPCNG